MKHKEFLSLLITVFIGSTAFSADIETKELTLRDRSFDTEVLLDTTTVRCSAIGYGLEELKISVPDLERYAFFDHSNSGESVPCMTAGACARVLHEVVVNPGFQVSDIVDPKIPTETIKINVVLKEVYTLDNVNKKCSRALTETANTTVRNIPFHHLRSGYLGDYPYNLCQLL